MPETTDMTPPQVKPAGDSVDALNARIAAAEANPETGKAHVVLGENVEPSAPQAGATIPEAGHPPAGSENGSGQQQTKDEKGKFDDKRIKESSKHLEIGIKEREELLKRNKELLSKFHETSQELSKTEKELKSLETRDEPPQRGVEGDREKQYLDRLARVGDDPKEILRIIDERAAEIARSESRDIREWRRQEQEQARFRAWDNELLELAKEGHAWLMEPGGLERLKPIFDERPSLLKESKNPYRDAIRLMDEVPGTAASPAQARSQTPILGGGVAVPPPSSQPPATTEQQMEALSADFQKALKYGDREKATELMRKMDAIQRGY